MSDSPELDAHRLRWGGPLAVVASIAAVVLIRETAVAIVRPEARFIPLSPPFPIFDTLVFASAAVLVFAKFCRFNADPVAEYRRLALRILLVSFVPDVLLGAQKWFGGGWPEALSLILMHVAVWAICITLLPAVVAVRDRVPR